MTQGPTTPLPPPTERRRLREAGSLTQGQLARRVGVTRETVRAWESGRTAPRGRKGEAYARLLASFTRPGDEQAAPPGDAETAGVTAGQQSMPVAAATGEQPRPAATEVVEKPEPVAAETWEQPGPVAAEVLEQPGAVAAEGREQSGPVAAEVREEGAGAGGSSLTPSQAFDALYAFCAPALVRQTYLLSGRRELAREAVEQAFQLAWDRWPEVAVDPDPAGWVRAAAYEYALSPWHRFRPRYRHPEPPPADASDRALLDALLTLPPPYRRTLVLHDGVGLRLPETAAETEASTPAAARRLVHAREAVAARLPELSDPTALGRRLAELASAERLRAARPTAVRAGSERRARFWTRAAIAFTVAIIGATALTVRSAPTHYEPPVAPGETVRGLPPKAAPGPLSQAELKLRAKLRREAANGPERLLPAAR